MTKCGSLDGSSYLLNDEVLTRFVKASRQLVDYWENINLNDADLLLKTTLVLTDWYVAGRGATKEHQYREEIILEKEAFNLKQRTYMQSECIVCQTVKTYLREDITMLYREMKIEFFKIDQIGTAESIASAIHTIKWNFYHHQEQHGRYILQYLQRVS